MKKIYLHDSTPSWECHRSGWNACIAQMQEHLHDESTLTALVPHVEAIFAENINIVEPWIGFVHNTPNHPESMWEMYDRFGVDMNTFFESEDWKKCEPRCKGLFVMSNYAEKHIKTMTRVPVETVYHPTEFPEIVFSPEKFIGNSNKRALFIGHWLRDYKSLYQIRTTNFTKTLLKSTGVDYKKVFSSYDIPLICPDVEHMDFVSNEDYDRLLECNIVFVRLHDASANNTVIECMTRNTPLIINKLPAVVEYLGEEYPLYYDEITEAESKIDDDNLILEGHEYLKQMDKSKLKFDNFINAIIESNIYKNISTKVLM